PCDQNLPNWDADNGYAGVVSRYVDFSVGNATDNSISNTFSALRNGVIGESCWLQVHHASFSDMVGEWTNPSAAPTLASSTGVGILATVGPATVQNCVFDGCIYGIFSSSVFFSALDNDMPEVRRGMEVLNPYACQIWDNEDIAFQNRGILVRDPQVNSFLSSWLRFDINRNDLRNFDQNDGGDIAIEIRGANGVYLPNARMSDNEIFLDAAESGILVKGTDHWTLDDNFIQHRALPNQQNSFGLGVQLQASRLNYLYNNTVEDIANTPGTRAFHTSQSTDNTFCCNNTSGNTIAYGFFGACAPAALRTSDMAGHQTCLEISQGSSIGEQGVFDLQIGDFINHGNLFNTGSGTARNWGTSFNEIFASRFHVLSDQTPDYPEAIDLPNISNPPADLWFDDDGVGEQDCAECPIPPQLPSGRSEILDENDRITAGTGFGTATQRHEALQWENSRNLYRRMREHAALHSQDSLVDAFYADALSGRIAEYYAADSLVRDVSVLSPSVSQGMEAAIQGMLQADSLVVLRLGALGTAVAWADSMEIYRQADSIRMDAAVLSRDLVAYIDTARTERKTKAVAALQVASALDAEEILERNRKDVLVIYCQTIGQENYQLTTTQAETIADIAYQCPEEGGSAVYLARAIYQLVEPTEFDDTILCGSEERSATGSISAVKPTFDLVLKPNPTSGSVSIIGLERAGSQSVQITLRHVSGQLALEKQFDLPNEALNFTLDGLSPGIYFFHVRMGNQTEIRKLILIR
ncbi:MAG: T9SS type A sorting domain-containing protein, partial [Saprospiraceae bacterium]